MIDFVIFDTALGRCGIAWRGDAIVGAALPAADGATTRSYVERRFHGAEERPAPEPIRHVIAMIVRLLKGEAVDFSAVQLSLEGTAQFERRVYAETRAIPHGETRTYG